MNDGPIAETDSRFPSGAWKGYWLQKSMGRKWMQLDLRFREGRVEGGGTDCIGPFAIKGTYSVEDGKCSWIKQYFGQHSVPYQGYAEGKGIWGTWTIGQYAMVLDKGGFHIWPRGQGGDAEMLEAEADEEVPVEAPPLVTT